MIAPPTVPELLRTYPVGPLIPIDAARGAVLALVRGGRHGTEVLLIERTRRSDDPASGQVALPGGTVNPDDASLEATALRECEEEVGIGADDLAEPPHFVRVGRVFVHQLPIAIFLAPLRDGARPPRRASPDEVAETFWFPLRHLWPAQPALVESQVGPREVDATLYEGRVLWGFTRKSLVDIASLVPPERPHAARIRGPPAPASVPSPERP